jgi:hypothetical protein
MCRNGRSLGQTSIKHVTPRGIGLAHKTLYHAGQLLPLLLRYSYEVRKPGDGDRPPKGVQSGDAYRMRATGIEYRAIQYRDTMACGMRSQGWEP